MNPIYPFAHRVLAILCAIGLKGTNFCMSEYLIPLMTAILEGLAQEN